MPFSASKLLFALAAISIQTLYCSSVVSLSLQQSARADEAKSKEQEQTAAISGDQSSVLRPKRQSPWILPNQPQQQAGPWSNPNIPLSFPVPQQLGNCRPLTEFQCSDGSCVSRGCVCNGWWDCRDGSDEWIDWFPFCPRPNTQPTPSPPPARTTTPKVTVPHRPIESRRCSNQSKEFYSCVDKSKCIRWEQICDNIRDCPFGEDELEAFCGPPPTPTWPSIWATPPPLQSGCGQAFRPAFECCDRLRCLQQHQLCNNIPECLDGSDESPQLCQNWHVNLQVRRPPVPPTNPPSFTCNPQAQLIPQPNFAGQPPNMGGGFGGPQFGGPQAQFGPQFQFQPQPQFGQPQFGPPQPNSDPRFTAGK